ncbi:MAG TPA: hypothetical protein GX715_04970 [Armatimonadetes bacterium]|nr:hypothetical protein [Armatimonadota bacterium]
MDQIPGSHSNPDDSRYPTKDEVDAAWLKLVVQPALLEEVKSALADRAHRGGRQEAPIRAGPRERPSPLAWLLRLLGRR